MIFSKRLSKTTKRLKIINNLVKNNLTKKCHHKFSR